MTATGSVDKALAFAEGSGWAPIPLMPLRKDAALAGYYQTASRDPKAIRAQWKRAQFRIDHDTDHPERVGMEPGIGVVLGRSGLAVLDADTPEQVAAVHAAFAAWGMELGEPTVLTPGTVDSNGVRLHEDGGHWYFKLPEDIVAAFSGLLAETKLVLKVGPEGSPKGDLMTGKCYVATPPTRRTEGEYLKTEGARLQALPRPLVVQLRVELTRIEQQRKDALERAATAERDEEMWAWFDRTPWETVLPDDYREVGVEPSGCVRYLREGGSSSHSATAHVTGCPHVHGGDPTQPPLCTFFTSEKPDYVVQALTRKDGTPKQSAGKFALFAAKFHGGNWRAARQAAGLSVRTSSGKPAVTRMAERAASVWEDYSAPAPGHITPNRGHKPKSSEHGLLTVRQRSARNSGIKSPMMPQRNGRPTTKPMPSTPLREQVADPVVESDNVWGYPAPAAENVWSESSEVGGDETGDPETWEPTPEVCDWGADSPTDVDDPGLQPQTPEAATTHTTEEDTITIDQPTDTGPDDAEPTEDEFVPVIEPGLPVGATLPAPFVPRDIAREVFFAAVNLSNRNPLNYATLEETNRILETEAVAGSFMGRDDDERNWTPRQVEMRKSRDWLMGRVPESSRQAPITVRSKFSTDQIAELVPDVSPARVRSVMRMLLPLFESAGMLVRERPKYDAFAYFGAKQASSGDSTIAGEDTDSDADDFDDPDNPPVNADGTEAPPANRTRPEEFTPGETEWLIIDSRDDPTEYPEFPTPAGLSTVDADYLPHDVPVLSRKHPTDPLIFVPPAGTDPTAAIEAVLASVPDDGIVGVDVETTGALWSDTVRLIQFGSATCAVVLDATDEVHLQAASDVIQNSILGGRVWATAHNSAFDALHLHRLGVADGIATMKHCFDTYILQTLVEAPLSDDEKKGGAADKRGLKALTAEWLGLDHSWSSAAEDRMRSAWAENKWRGQQGWSKCPSDMPEYLFYSGCDVVDAARLCGTLLATLESGVADAKTVIEREHLIAADAGLMQLNGFLLDLPALARDEKDREADVERTKAAVEAFGIEKVNSPKEIATALNVERAKVIDCRVTEAVVEGKDAATERATLEQVIPEITSTAKPILKAMTWSKLAPALLEYRAVAKTAGTYTTAWPKAADESGRLHPNINTLKASTGRFSSSGPNMQNVPAGVRPYFIAGYGKSLVTSDFASIEMRVGAAYAGEDALTADYLAGLDPYREVAKMAFDTDDPTKTERNMTKPILLGRMYGRGAPSLAREQLARDPDQDFDELVERADRIMREGIDKRYPGLRQASFRLAGQVRAGHTRIVFDSGRTISIDPSNARKAFNALVQGAARELLVDAAQRIRNSGLGHCLWLPVHDEWVLLVDEDKAEEVKHRLVEIMTTTFRGVPVVAEAAVLGPHWKKGD